jgi:hypothetical protein
MGRGDGGGGGTITEGTRGDTTWGQNNYETFMCEYFCLTVLHFIIFMVPSCQGGPVIDKAFIIIQSGYPVIQ